MPVQAAWFLKLPMPAWHTLHSCLTDTPRQLPQVELLELPPGVPELLPVVCNGHRAQLALRTQRVVYRGQEMAPSRFEAMAGATEGVQGACRGLGASWRLACMPVGSRAGVQDRLPLSWC
jgi:hypothetical protein